MEEGVMPAITQAKLQTSIALQHERFLPSSTAASAATSWPSSHGNSAPSPAYKTLAIYCNIQCAKPSTILSDHPIPCSISVANTNTQCAKHLALAMASKVCAAAALLLSLNLLFFTMVSATHVPCPPPPAVKPPPAKASCPRNALKLGVCGNVLNLLKLKLGTPPKYPCCPLLEGLVDLEAAVCLCTAVKANVLGIHLNIPVDLSLLLNFCGKKVPRGFKCA